MIRNTPRPSVRCTEGTFIEKMHEGLFFSERQRKRVSDLADQISDVARAQLISRCQARKAAPPTASQLAVVADEAIGRDVRWKTATADEQWGYRLTTMYAAAETATALRETNSLLRDLINAQQMTNQLLAAMLNLRDTPPQQRTNDNISSHDPSHDDSV